MDTEDHLLIALDHILAALVQDAGLSGIEVPNEALDAALATPEIKAASRAFCAALSPSLTAQPKDSYLVEELGMALGAICAEAGFKLGRMLIQGVRTP